MSLNSNSLDLKKDNLGNYVSVIKYSKGIRLCESYILLSKLQCYGIRENVFNWLKSNLTDCTQFFAYTHVFYRLKSGKKFAESAGINERVIDSVRRLNLCHESSKRHLEDVLQCNAN